MSPSCFPLKLKLFLQKNSFFDLVFKEVNLLRAYLYAFMMISDLLLIALFLGLFRCFIRVFRVLLIHGQYLSDTLISLIGACFSTTNLNLVVYSSTKISTLSVSGKI